MALALKLLHCNQAVSAGFIAMRWKPYLLYMAVLLQIDLYLEPQDSKGMVLEAGIISISQSR